jgi:recombinational DNA repair protein (RecF pathway)
MGILFQLQGPLLITKLLKAAAQNSSLVKLFFEYLQTFFAISQGGTLPGWALRETALLNAAGAGYSKVSSKFCLY